MADYAAIKSLIELEVRALGDRAQAASDLAEAFKGDIWGEVINNFLESYHHDIIEYRTRLWELFDHVTRREEEERSEKTNPVSVLARIAARLEEAGGRLAAGVEAFHEVGGQLATGIQTLQSGIQTLHEASERFTAGVEELQESAQLYQGIADYAREAVSTLQPDGSVSPAPEDDSVPPDPEQGGNPSQDPDIWHKS